MRILEMKEKSYQDRSIQNVTQTCPCQFLLTHSIKTQLESTVSCFQELGPWETESIFLPWEEKCHQ